MPLCLCDFARAVVGTVAIKVGIALVGTGCLLLALAHAASPNRRYYSGSYACRRASVIPLARMWIPLLLKWASRS